MAGTIDSSSSSGVTRATLLHTPAPHDNGIRLHPSLSTSVSKKMIAFTGNNSLRR